MLAFAKRWIYRACKVKAKVNLEMKLFGREQTLHKEVHPGGNQNLWLAGSTDGNFLTSEVYVNNIAAAVNHCLVLPPYLEWKREDIIISKIVYFLDRSTLHELTHQFGKFYHPHDCQVPENYTEEEAKRYLLGRGVQTYTPENIDSRLENLILDLHGPYI